jgi:glycosyltransferase involved in cell wall biosynthesis
MRKRIEISVILPAFNEADIIEKTVLDISGYLKKKRKTYEIIVSENGSTDNTIEILRELSRQKELHLSYLHSNIPDVGLATKNGVLKAKGDLILLFDVDYWDTMFIDLCIRTIGYDYILGSKTHPKSKDSRAWYRKLNTRVFNMVDKILFNLPVSDVHGMKGFSQKIKYPIRDVVLGKDIFHTELILRAAKSGLKFYEVPVLVKEIRPSRISLPRRVMRTFFYLIKLKQVMNQDRS